MTADNTWTTTLRRLVKLFLLIFARPNRGRLMVYDWRLWVLVGTAVVATTAFECVASHTHIKLVEVDGKVYAFGHEKFRDIYEYDGVYDPDSKNWRYVEDTPAALEEISRTPPSLPVTKCVPELPSICYRIEGDERVLRSENGGEGWQTAWEVPPGRRYFMSRITNSCTGKIDMGPYDLLISGSGEGHIVFVAAGTEGAIVRYPDGNWERQRILGSEPTPFKSFSIGYIFFATIFEQILLLFVVIAIGFFHAIYFLRRPFLFLVTPVLSLLMATVWIGSTGDYSAIPVLIAFIVIQLIGIGIFIIAYKLAGDKRKIVHRNKADQALMTVLWSTIGLWLAGVFIIALWVTGIIPVYWLMMVLLVGTAVLVARWSVKVNHRLLAESKALMGDLT